MLEAWVLRVSPEEIPFEGWVTLTEGETIKLLPKGQSKPRVEIEVAWEPDGSIYEDEVDREINELAMYGIDDCVNDSDGYRTLPRLVQVTPTRELAEVWKRAEEKLHVPRDRYALIFQSHYRPQTGRWDKEIQWVETRCRGRAGRQERVTLPLKSTITWTDPSTGETESYRTASTWTGKSLLKSLEQIQEMDDQVLYRVIEGDRFGIGQDTPLFGEEIQVLHHEDFDEDASDHLVRGVCVIDEDGAKVQTSAISYEGDGATIKAQLQEGSCYSVRTVWRGLHPLKAEDIAIGAVLDIEYEEKPKTMTIKFNSEEEPFYMVTLARPLEELFQMLRVEFGRPSYWELYFERDGKRMTYDQTLAGSTWVLKAIQGRDTMV
jgi:hypothetical protein